MDHSLNGRRWTAAEIAELRRLCSSNTLFMSEIAEKLGRRPGTVRWKAHKLGIWSKPEGRFAEWNRKHAHLREAVMQYFVTHSMEETRKHFGLTRSEIKSIFTVGYRDPKLKHLRKEWRPHSAWSTEDWLFMVRSVGIQPREWIGRKLKRGETYNSVKDALAKFRGYGKYMNGMPWGWAEPLFGLDAHRYAIKTKARPAGNAGNFRYKIIPWVTCERLVEQGRIRKKLGKGKCRPERKHSAPSIPVSPDVYDGIRAMAKFQRWIFGVQSERVIVRKIEATLRRR